MSEKNLMRLEGLAPRPDGSYWPTREEWAKDRQTRLDINPDATAEYLDSYLDSCEQDQWVEAANQYWRNAGRWMKTADQSERAYLQILRSEVRAAIKAAEQWYELGKSATKTLHRVSQLVEQSTDYPAPDAIRLFNRRYEERLRKLHEAKRCEAEQRPIDDEAWEEEIQLRVEHEAYFSRHTRGAA